MTSIENQPEVQFLLGMAEIAVGVTSIGGASIAAKGAKRLANQLVQHESISKPLPWAETLIKDYVESKKKGMEKLQNFFGDALPYAPLFIGAVNPGLGIGIAGAYLADYLADRLDFKACSPFDLGVASFLGLNPLIGSPIVFGTLAMLPECEASLKDVPQAVVDTAVDVAANAAGMLLSGGLATMGAKAVGKAIPKPDEADWKDYLAPVVPILSFF